MKAGFYPKLALDGIRKNKRMYFPYILTCVAMVTVYYIILFLSDVRGETTKAFMDVGGWVIAVFSVVFLFYTNSFLMRRRKKEFGLYNILGMGKRHIGLILLWETLIVYVAAVALGLIIGISLSKMADLALVSFISGEVTYELSVSFESLIQTVMLFAVIFLLLLLNGLRQIRFSSTIALLQSEALGEKPPKANWFLGILGLMCIAGGYAISLSIDNPLTALPGFFIAVVLVIAGTYLTMIAGSVLFCKILQKNKKYYYNANHFVSVSSMVYRMKRNGAGLASICILATMVLVTISSTASLYIGGEGAIRDRYPREINITLRYNDFDEETETDMKSLPSEVRAICEEYDVTPTNTVDYREASIAGQIQGNTVETDPTAVNQFSVYSYQNVVVFYFLPLDNYKQMSGTDISLKDGEAMMVSSEYDYKESTISFKTGRQFTIVEKSKELFVPKDSIEYLVPVIYLIVPDIHYAVQGIDTLADYNGDRMVQFHRYYYFDTEKDGEIQMKLCDLLYNRYDSHRFDSMRIESREEHRDDFYSLYGSMFYLGIVLSLVFLMAAVLIIYYKQISEGYEDQKRFEIMQKVGMTKREIRKSINSQLLTVFFLPLVFAGLHLAFAFPIVSKLLLMFGLMNNALLITTTVACFVIFALFYTVVYKITSNAYYKIVSDDMK